tara:strand:+ start:1828 stop:2331 length:504 start_codon:yes stop_codon:yes gene_type:complete
MNVKWDDDLQPGQLENPVIYTETLDLPDIVKTPSSDELALVFPKPNHSLKTWGRSGKLDDDPHWIAVQKQTPLHRDPRYPKYTHHILLRVDNFVLRGITKVPEISLSRGTYLVLDGHSPHQLFSKSKDAKFYIACSMDSNQIFDKSYAIERLIEYASTAPFITDDLK